MKKRLRRQKARAKVGRVSHMPLLKCLLVLLWRPQFNALLVQPPPFLEVQLPPLLSLPSIMLSLVLIAAQSSLQGLARGRLLHRRHLQLVPRGHLLSLWLRMKTRERSLRILWRPRFPSGLPPYTRIFNQDLCDNILFYLFCDRNDSPNCWLGLVGLENEVRMLCLYLIFLSSFDSFQSTFCKCPIFFLMLMFHSSC